MGFDTDIMPGLEVLEVEHPPSCISTVERRATEVHRKATFLRGITDNNRGIHSRCFRDTLAVCNRVSIRVRVIVVLVIIISTTISTVSIASSTSSYGGAVGVLIIVISHHHRGLRDAREMRECVESSWVEVHQAVPVLVPDLHQREY